MNPAKSSGQSLLEISISGPLRHIDRLNMIRCFLMGQGFKRDDIVQMESKTKFKLCVYKKCSAGPSPAKIMRNFLILNLRTFQFEVKRLKKEDWFHRWKRDYHILPAGRKFLIVPVWEQKMIKSVKRTPILLDPGCAFGSGAHETTRLMILMMEKLQGKFSDFLDVGTGTGILAIAGARLGARKVVAIDHHAASVKNAKWNYRNNRCEAHSVFRAIDLNKFDTNEQFDLVAANLLTRTLLAFKNKLLKWVRNGRYLAVSGIDKKNLPMFLKGFQQRGYRRLLILKGRSWAAVLYRKKSDSILSNAVT